MVSFISSILKFLPHCFFISITFPPYLEATSAILFPNKPELKTNVLSSFSIILAKAASIPALPVPEIAKVVLLFVLNNCLRFSDI